MSYCGNNICPDKQTNRRMNEHGGQTAGKHNAFADTVRWRTHKVVKFYHVKDYRQQFVKVINFS